MQRHLRRLLGGVENDGGAVLAGFLAAVAGTRNCVKIGSAGVEVAYMSASFALHQLEFADALAKLFAVVQVGNHVDPCRPA